MARLDRLGPAKEVIQIGAVIGSEFSYELLQAVHPIAEVNLQQALNRLADAELLYVRGIAPDATYRFKHALIRDTAYEALLKSRRKELHLVVARAIDENFPTLKETHPEVLARHWTEADETKPAIVEWSRAGKRAEVRNAFREALDSYQKRSVSLIGELPESSERDRRELDIWQAIVRVLRVTHGYAASETVSATERVEVLARRIGDLRLLSNSAMGRCLAASTAGRFSFALVFADQALEFAFREGSQLILAGAYCLEAIVRYWCSDLTGIPCLPRSRQSSI